jgi:hypothetical protein
MIQPVIEMEVCPTCLLQTYTIARIRFSNSNTIKLDFIDGDFLYKQINAGRMKLKHETDELYGTFLIKRAFYLNELAAIPYRKWRKRNDRYFFFFFFFFSTKKISVTP